MKQLLLGFALALGLTLAAPSTFAAADSDSDSGVDSDSGPTLRSGGSSGSGSGLSHAPELDPTVGGSAMLLLLGGVAYLASRKRDED